MQPVTAPTVTSAASAAMGDALRAALSRFATGVTIVTCYGADGKPAGLTCNSFNSLSLNPPMVTWALSTASPSRAAFEHSGRFVVNVLHAAQRGLAESFARRGHDKFAGVTLSAEADSPVIADVLAWFECRTVATHSYGDHVLFVGAVERYSDFGHADEPLLFMNGKLG
jgi:flavin reductase (DIM6/NTAB) family NADH-FMN oxidoreductase RutF